MKHFIFSMLLLIFVGSCKKDKIEYKTEFAKSEKAWHAFKKSSGNSYEYVVDRSSWVGLFYQTTITVTKGKVTRRKYTQSYNGGPGGPPGVEQSWEETETEIGTHPSSGAADAITLDEVYAKAKSDWLLPRDHTITFFETKNNGLISICGYRDKNCADDCFIGISISSIRAL